LPIAIVTGQSTEVMIMYKWLAVIVAIYLIGDPILENISSVITVGEMNELLLTGVISLFLIPWVSAQFDN
jgi:hypothetical protein